MTAACASERRTANSRQSSSTRTDFEALVTLREISINPLFRRARPTNETFALRDAARSEAVKDHDVEYARRVIAARTAGRLRWSIGALLFLSTVVNYIDRQTLSVLAPALKDEYRWTNSDFALVIISFRVAYTLGQAGAGRFLDAVGTRAGLTVTVAFYSIAAMLTSLAGGLRSFCFFRFLLGAGEGGNWPGATKAVAEWFPRRESGWAVALFDSGSSIGAAIAPLLAVGLLHTFGTWRPVFLITGALGFLWLLLFRAWYFPPEIHPRISAAEREYILADRDRPDETGPHVRPPGYAALLRLPQTWGIVIGKALTDPVWFFITDWFFIYLASRGFSLERGVLAFWIPFVAADAGNFLGGGFSSYLIARGLSVGTARKTVIVVSGLGMTTLMASLLFTTLPALTVCFAVATCSYAALSTMVLNLPADLYRSESVATVSGLSGAGAGIGTIAATYLTGVVADRYSFGPILIGASLVPLLAVVAVLALVRNTGTSRLVRTI
jgi:ACS family hexuronate transporter-like MFS transporter